ncbi:hypothetical protein Goshw_022030 [Gossypium schwendimanii]|uniref:Uncharacterized protein n=1 Tax=Gossypium schwendimanii TaxID=34291 RepID=A0A7J9NEM0_GOSSC|nr:hypothetical protein [Gossypium schwendimanii]
MTWKWRRHSLRRSLWQMHMETIRQKGFLDDNEIALHEDDVHISTDDPYIRFSKRVHGLIDQSMHQMLIDYDKVLVGGSWMVYGHYLIAQP